MTLGLKAGQREVDADLVLATDPDADRLGVHVKDTKTGEYHTLTGNMSGCLLEEYELSQRKAGSTASLPAGRSSGQHASLPQTWQDTIAKAYGLRFIEVLTGFKYIGQQILGFETERKRHLPLRIRGELRLPHRHPCPR